jgi:hypothetical protein
VDLIESYFKLLPKNVLDVIKSYFIIGQINKDIIQSEFNYWPNKCGFNKVGIYYRPNKCGFNKLILNFIIGQINVDSIKSEFKYWPNKCGFNKVILYYWSNKWQVNKVRI